jgi:hypothetical protein
MRVRRLLAGELSGAEKERVERHVIGCARCAETQREIALEAEALRRDVPFPAFAAGVAERLAQRPKRSMIARWAPLAAAAGLALASGAALVLRPADTEGVRSKGAATAQLFVEDAGGVRELHQEAVAPGAKLLLALHPGGRKSAAAVLIEPGETSVLYSGPAVNGPLPKAFEWTGQGAATLLVVFADQPLDAGKLHGAQDAPRGSDVVEVKLHR